MSVVLGALPRPHRSCLFRRCGPASVREAAAIDIHLFAMVSDTRAYSPRPPSLLSSTCLWALNLHLLVGPGLATFTLSESEQTTLSQTNELKPSVIALAGPPQAMTHSLEWATCTLGPQQIRIQEHLCPATSRRALSEDEESAHTLAPHPPGRLVVYLWRLAYTDKLSLKRQ